jgi:hypothetical protein
MRVMAELHFQAPIGIENYSFAGSKNEWGIA